MKILLPLFIFILLCGCDNKENCQNIIPTPLSIEEKDVLISCLEASKTIAGPAAYECERLIKHLRE